YRFSLRSGFDRSASAGGPLPSFLILVIASGAKQREAIRSEIPLLDGFIAELVIGPRASRGPVGSSQ
ncbi:MAG TPA: hypothetical protein VHX43_10510, partial [Xanthobacteraceae bacterium]|nr:hypothetical protein [Xanthobacteraceae bacterium]